MLPKSGTTMVRRSHAGTMKGKDKHVIRINLFHLFIGTASVFSFYAFFLVGTLMGRTIADLDTEDPNILDTLRWARYPDGWEKYTFSEISEHFKCSAYKYDNFKELPTLEEWNLLRDKWREVVDAEQTFDEEVPPTQGYSHTVFDGPPPYYAARSPGKGRGIFAYRDIKEGELVHDGTKDAVFFPDAMAFRRYIFSLPRDSACSVEQWSWTQKLKIGGPMMHATAMDISVLMNSAKGDDGLANLLPDSDTSLQFFATRDIEKDEELLTEYWIRPSSWESVGL